MVFVVAQMVKHLPAMRETWVQSPGQEDPLEEGVAPTPVFLPGESPWTEEPGRLQPVASHRVTRLKQASSSSRLREQDVTAFLIEESTVKIDHTKCDQDVE